jgi:succinoglycan biosynthesis transport protein ExoP
MNADPNILQQLPVDIGVSQEPSRPVASRPTSNDKNPQRASTNRRTDQIAEAEYANLVRRVFLQPADVPQVVVFSGIDPGNGCTRVCRKTAEVLTAASCGTVCLVNADLYSPQSPRAQSNLSRSTESRASGGPVRTYVHEMEIQNLWTLPRGYTGSNRNNPIAIDIVRARVQELRQEFDRILIDAPPLNQCGDAMALAQLGDGLIVVIEANATRRQTARKVMETLGQAGVKVLGVVLNKRMFPIPEKLYRQL